MNLSSCIEEIVNSIKRQEFINVAEISNGVILRILYELDWDIFNVHQVKPLVIEPNTKKIFTLLINNNERARIVIKDSPLDDWNKGNLDFSHPNFISKIFTIHTDGQKWLFYLPAHGNKITHRCFLQFDLLTLSPDELTDLFLKYLSFESIDSGNAINEANDILSEKLRTKEIETALPISFWELVRTQNPSLFDLLSDKVQDICGYVPSENEIVSFFEAIKPKDCLVDNEPEPDNSNINPMVNANFRGIVINGEIYFRSYSAIRVLESFLILAVTKFPNALQVIQKETEGNSRKLLSKNKSELYRDRPDFVATRSKALPNGWWFGNNYSTERIDFFCSQIQMSINLVYGNQHIEWKI